MRRPRVKVDGEGFYHVVSRIGGKRFLIDEDEKRILLGMIRGAAAFSGVELYTFAVMSNHFHLLVRVPRKKAVSDKELERRMLAWYGPGKFAAILEKWEEWTKTKRHENTGTIWEGRFKSILLEGSFRALMTVAGYVHLNPVRAAMVERPEESRWTGYGAGCQGDLAAQDGLRDLVSRACGAKETEWNEAKRACANAIDGKVPESAPRPKDAPLPEDVVETDDRGRPVRAGSLRALLTRRVAGFLHGGALGEERFLKRVAEYLPPRVRRRAEGLFDRCPFLGLESAAGVREVS